ncbi:fungal pheromone mating factor STE2 GPCR-domain-containing protein [Chaetomium sp. MPI-SDFR-AT-0129]|nr:fungal pheromone mating factor STE2 GPCR-domain-containing protein [Chaetomium sp. MPI-SDFR-AT-0129]
MSTTTNPPGLGSGANTSFDPQTQTLTLFLHDGITPTTLSASLVTRTYLQATSLSILYGTQIGACLAMLAVVLGMTPQARFRRAPTLLGIAALVLNAARMLLLALFFTTTWLDLYVIISQDTSVVPWDDVILSVAGTALSVPVTVVVLSGLGVQAWSMLRLWPVWWKVPAVMGSFALVLLTVAFNLFTTVLQIRTIVYTEIREISLWARQAYLVLATTSICWFCFLFNVRLVMHMWTNRSVLPSLNGLEAMDVLIMTNGILMFVPVIFSALEFFNWQRVELASVTQTSVVIILPLGTLIAQRLANPVWFGTNEEINRNRNAGSLGDTNGTGATLTLTSSNNGNISLSRSAVSGTTTIGTTKRPLLASVKKYHHGQRDSMNEDGVHHGAGQGAVLTHIEAIIDDSGITDKSKAFHDDGRDMPSAQEMDVLDLERGVRVDYGIELREERVQSTGSS